MLKRKKFSRFVTCCSSRVPESIEKIFILFHLPPKSEKFLLFAVAHFHLFVVLRSLIG
jgi:hypothetical protein